MDERQRLLQKLCHDVDDVKVIMQENLIRAEDRRETLNELDARADKLELCSKRFARTTRRAIESRRRCNCTCKAICCLVFWPIVIAVIILVIIGTRNHIL